MLVFRHPFIILPLPPLRRFLRIFPLPRMSRPLDPPTPSLIRVEACSHASTSAIVDDAQTTTLISTPWLSLQSLRYRYAHDPPGRPLRKWDCANRTTRPAAAGTDAVFVLAILRDDEGPRVLLVRQFRPPMRSVSVELPAGLVDEGEEVEDAALRELREETGYEGVVTKVHAPSSLSPGMTGETIVLVEVEVSGRREQQVDGEENIEVVSVPLGKLEEALEVMREDGIVVKNAVLTLAVGLRLGSSMLQAK